MIAGTYHSGHVNRKGFSLGSGGGSGSGSIYSSLHYNRKLNNLNVNSTLYAPYYGITQWMSVAQGYYFGVDYNLKEIQVLWNDINNFSAGLTCTITIRRVLADGGVAAPIAMDTIITTFPNFFGSGFFYGAVKTGITVLCPAGYYVYGIITQKSGGLTLDDVNMWLLFEKV